MSHAPFRVIVAGGGPAAVETILALHELAPKAFEIDLVTTSAELVLRPYEVLAPFREGQGRRYPLARIAEDANARLVRDGIATVDPLARRIVTHAGVERRYDALVVAVGAQRVHPIGGALAFRGSRDANAIKALLMESHSGRHGRFAFIVPGGATWPLPIYELALHTAVWLEERRVHSVPLTVVSPERAPLVVFGREASDEVARLLDAHEIAFVQGHATHLRGDRLLLLGGDELEVDAAITLPRLVGAQIAGLAADRDGFLPVDEFGRIEGMDREFAAGDITAFPIKQGGVATQQADAIAEQLAALAGETVQPQPFGPVLRGILWAGPETRYMLTEFDDHGGTTSSVSSEPLWSPPSKLAGRYLAPYLAHVDTAATALSR
jgi:sulfide:quinone oxidoreductase